MFDDRTFDADPPEPQFAVPWQDREFFQAQADMLGLTLWRCVNAPCIYAFRSDLADPPLCPTHKNWMTSAPPVEWPAQPKANAEAPKQAGASVPRCPEHDVPLSGGDCCPVCFAQPKTSRSPSPSVTTPGETYGAVTGGNGRSPRPTGGEPDA